MKNLELFLEQMKTKMELVSLMHFHLFQTSTYTQLNLIGLLKGIVD